MKIGRDAFLYLEPKGDGADFAQCSTCRDYPRDGERRCAILGPVFDVAPEDSCGAYIEGAFEGGTLRNLTTPKAVGFVRRKVRCENCVYGGERCALYRRLNETFPDLFDLEERIVPRGCCNAQTPK